MPHIFIRNCNYNYN